MSSHQRSGPPAHPRMDALFGQFEAVCTWQGCNGKLKFENAHSGGLRVGDMVYQDHRDMFFGRCPHCKRYQMKVVKAPEVQLPPGPKGFTRIPIK
jgi:hypothetical protein